MPLMGYEVAAPQPPPEVWAEGETVTLRPRLFGLFRLGAHLVRVVEIDKENFVLRTDERGGAILRWDHRMQIKPLAAGYCLQTESIDVESAYGSWILLPLAQALCRYRHARRRSQLRYVCRQP